LHRSDRVFKLNNNLNPLLRKFLEKNEKYLINFLIPNERKGIT